jgi:hypothetical protein
VSYHKYDDVFLEMILRQYNQQTSAILFSLPENSKTIKRVIFQTKKTWKHELLGWGEGWVLGWVLNIVMMIFFLELRESQLLY